MNYQQQIKHPLWQKKRLEVLEDRGFRCQECGANDEELHVHHPLYKRGAMIWEYTKEELESLCHRCHKNAHELDEKIKKELAVCKSKRLVLEYIRSLNTVAVTQDIPAIAASDDYVKDEGDYEDIEQILKEHPSMSHADAFFYRMKHLMGGAE